MHDIIDFSSGLDKRLLDDNRLIILEPTLLTDEQLLSCTSSLQQVFHFIRDANSKERIRTLLNTDKTFRAMPYRAAQVIAQITSTRIKLTKNFGEKNTVDMCLAIAEMIPESRQAAEQRLVQERQRADAAVGSLKRGVRKLARDCSMTVGQIEEIFGQTEAQISEWIGGTANA